MCGGGGWRGTKEGKRNKNLAKEEIRLFLLVLLRYIVTDLRTTGNMWKTAVSERANKLMTSEDLLLGEYSGPKGHPAKC